MDCCLTKLIIFCCCFFLILSFTEIKSRVLLRLTLWERCEINKVLIGKLLIKSSKLQLINLSSKAADEAVVTATQTPSDLENCPAGPGAPKAALRALRETVSPQDGVSL